MSTHQPRHGAGVETTTTRTGHAPRHAVDRELIEDIEWATGKNGTTFLSQIREHGLDIVRADARAELAEFIREDDGTDSGRRPA